MKKHIFKVLSAILLISLVLSVIVVPATAADTSVNADAFTSVIMNVGADETKRNLTWYHTGNASAKVLYGASTDGTLPSSYSTATATGTAASKSGYYSYKATMTGLKENTTYAYQLVVGDEASKVYTFKTYDFDESFSFAFTGDPQVTQYTSQWADTMKKITTKFGDISFVVSPGDQITVYDDELGYDKFTNEYMTSIGIATTVGPAHDAVYSGTDTKAQQYIDHYNLPNLTKYGKSNTSSDYYYTYGDVLFMHLNVVSNASGSVTTDLVNEHKTFMQEAMTATNCTWNIVVMHYAFYSFGDHAQDGITLAYRNAFVPVFNELDIDVVLSGHDHVYSRSHFMTGVETIGQTAPSDSSVLDPVGTLYLTGTSSTGTTWYDKEYSGNDQYIANQNDANEKGVTIFTVTGNTLTLTAYNIKESTPTKYDSLTIEKTQNVVEPEPDEPDEPTIPEGTTCVVTVDGSTVYSTETDLYNIIKTYNSADYVGKDINIKLLADISYSTENADFKAFNLIVDLAGKTLTMGKRYNIGGNAKLHIYSSVAGAKLEMGSSGILQLYKGSELVIGHNDAQYKDFITVNSTHYITYTTNLSSSSTIKIDYYNAILNSGRYGLYCVRGNSNTSPSTPTLTSTIDGCTVNAMRSVFAFSDSSSYTSSGYCSANSTVEVTNSSFTTSDKSYGFFRKDLFADKYAGSIKFTGCTFDKFTINSELIPAATVTFGDGCEFTNSGTTFTGTAFTASNNKLDTGCSIREESGKLIIYSGSAPTPTIPDDATCVVYVDGVYHTYHTFTSFGSIATEYNNSNYANKEVTIVLCKDMTDTYSSSTLTSKDGTVFKIDLAGHKLSLNNRLNIQGNNDVIYLYSSVAGGDAVLSGDFAFQTNNNLTLIIGTDDLSTPDKYKNNLKVSGGGNYFLYANNVSGKTITFKCYYTNIVTGTTNCGLIANKMSGDCTLDVEIIGSKVTGRGPIFMLKGGTSSFDANSTFVAKNVSFTSAETQFNFFDADAQYKGKMSFEGCTFNNYVFNSSNQGASEIIFGDKCSFTNAGGTFTNGAFTDSSIKLADECVLTVGEDGTSATIAVPQLPITATVTVDGVETTYHETNLTTLLSSLSTKYAGKTIVIKLNKENATAFTTSSAINIDGEIKVVIDLAGATLTMGGDINVFSNSSFQLYSSVAGSTLTMGSCRFHLKNNSTLTLGYDKAEYKGNLTVDTTSFILYTDNLSSGATLTLNFLYSKINTAGYGLMRIRSSTGNTPKLIATIKGCDIAGTKVFVSRSGSEGIFTDSTVVATDSTFTAPDGSVAKFFDTGTDAFTNRFNGKMTFTNCKFENYTINSDTIASATLTFGAGCEFINSGSTFTGTAFTQSNNMLASGYELKADGGKMLVVEKSTEPEIPEEPEVPVIPEGTTCAVTVNGVTTYYSNTIFAEIFGLYTGYSEILFTLYDDITDTNNTEIGLPANSIVKIDLNGNELKLSKKFQAQSDGSTVYIYSSVAGATLNLRSSSGFQTSKNLTIVIGTDDIATPDKYTHNLTVNNATNYLIYPNGLSTDRVLTVKFYYTDIVGDENNNFGIIRSGLSKNNPLDFEIIGCKITLSVPFFYNKNASGYAFAATSTFVVKDSTFEATTAANLFCDTATDNTNPFTNMYLGSMEFTNCTFTNYILNASVVPDATITIGEGCSFTTDPTASNVTLAEGCKLTMQDGKYVVTKSGDPVEPEVPVIPEDTTCAVTVNGVTTYHSNTIFAEIFGLYTGYSEILFTLYDDITDTNNTEIGLPANSIVKIDLNGNELKLSKKFQAQSDGSTVYIYSSVAGATLNLRSSSGFQTSKNLTIVIGTDDIATPDKYTHNLTVNNATNYLIYPNGLSTDRVLTVKFYYTDIVGDENNNFGIIRSGLSKNNPLDFEIIGCKITLSVPFFYNKNASGYAFAATSTFVVKDSTFEATTAANLFCDTATDNTNPFTNMYLGSMEFTNCTFTNYILNASVVPDATITIGAGCTFTNYGDSIKDGKFTASNIVLAKGYQLTLDGTTYVVVEAKEDNSKFNPMSNITLHSQLVYNVYIPALDQVKEVVLDGNTITDFSIFEVIDVDGKQYYKLPVYLGVAEAMRDITLKMTAVNDAGKTGTGTWTLSIGAYATSLINGNYTEVEKTLIKDLLSYIRSAYVYDDYVNETNNSASVVALIDAIIGTDYNQTSAPNTNIETKEETEGLRSASLQLGNAPTFEFQVGSGYTVDQYEFFVGGKKVDFTYQTVGKRTYMYVTLYAYELTETISYKIVGTDITGEYNIKAYYDGVAGEEDVIDTLIERLWKYSESAKAYYESQNNQ